MILFTNNNFVDKKGLLLILSTDQFDQKVYLSVMIGLKNIRSSSYIYRHQLSCNSSMTTSSFFLSERDGFSGRTHNLKVWFPWLKEGWKKGKSQLTEGPVVGDYTIRTTGDDDECLHHNKIMIGWFHLWGNTFDSGLPCCMSWMLISWRRGTWERKKDRYIRESFCQDPILGREEDQQMMRSLSLAFISHPVIQTPPVTQIVLKGGDTITMWKENDRSSFLCWDMR